MPTPKPAPPVRRTAADSTEAVDAFLRALEHPLKAEIEALRRILLGAHPSIAEGIKWNAPSFRTTEYFATFHLRSADGVRLILHRGARARGASHPGVQVPDPTGLLTWLGSDRATALFTSAGEIESRSAALAEVVRHWIAHV